MSHALDRFRYCPACGSSHFLPSSFKSKQCSDCGFEFFLNPAAACVAFIRNAKGELLVAVRDREPARGTLDLPGGFSDMGENSEQSIRREVLEETGLNVGQVRFLFSLPNLYLYSGMHIPTLDMFYECQVADTSTLCAADDVSRLLWVPLADVQPQLFGLDSVRRGVERFLKASPSKASPPAPLPRRGE